MVVQQNATKKKKAHSALKHRSNLRRIVRNDSGDAASTKKEHRSADVSSHPRTEIVIVNPNGAADASTRGHDHALCTMME